MKSEQNRNITVGEMLSEAVSREYRRDKVWSIMLRVFANTGWAAGVALLLILIASSIGHGFSFRSPIIPVCAIAFYASYECRCVYLRRRKHQREMLERLRCDPAAIRAALDLLHSEQEPEIVQAAQDAVRLHLQHPPELELTYAQARALSGLLHCHDESIVRLIPHAIAVMGDRESAAELGSFVAIVDNDSGFAAEVLSARDFLLERLDKRLSKSTLLRHVADQSPEDEATLLRTTS